ncbi:MAG: redoxin domain-containing protein [Bacillota bacterium]
MLLSERHKDLQGLGVEVVAISVDHLPALKVFDKALAEFPFPLAADWHRGICRQYGFLDEEQQVSRRALLLCDGQAVVRHVVDHFLPGQTDRLEGLLATARGMRG